MGSETVFGTNYFGIVDYVILLASLIICLLVGVYYVYFSKHTNEELLVGGRDLSVFPVAASLMVSFFSAITILGYPSEIYDFGIEIFMQGICQSIGIAICAFLFVPFFYPMKITSIYEYLEHRFDSKALRRTASSIFICEQVALAGMILYAPSIALQSFLGLPMAISILGLGVCCTMYTSLGGLKAVVWTDTFQFFLMILGLGGILVKAFMEAGGVVPAFQIAYDNGRLNLLKHNTFNFLLGSTIAQCIRTGIHQLTVQRYMSLPNVKRASRAILGSIPMKLLVMGIMVLCGIALYSANAGCDPVKSGKIKKKDQMVTQFVVEKLGYIPGALGLFTAVVFSGVLSSLSSMLNSLAAVTWEDYLSRIPRFKRMGERSQTNISRLLSFGFGVIAMAVAFLCQYLDKIYAAFFAITGVTVGAINGIFLMGVFMPSVNKVGAVGGTLVSLITIGYVCALGFIYKADKHSLPTSIDGCVNFTALIHIAGLPNFEKPALYEPTFPANLYKLSYIMYPTIGSLIGVIVGCVISACTGGFRAEQRAKINRKYVHPSVRCLVPLASIPDAQEFHLRAKQLD